MAMGKHFYRCGKCRKRAVLKKSLEEYVIIPKCKSCSSQVWHIDLHRYKEWKAKTGAYQVCHCNGLHYPHRVGASDSVTGGFCYSGGKEPVKEVADDDYMKDIGINEGKNEAVSP